MSTGGKGANKPKVNLKAIGSVTRVGGKGAPRRSFKGKTQNTQSDAEKKVLPVLKKVSAQQIPCESVTMFKGNGAMQFKNPAFYASIHSNTFAVSGKYEEKTFDQLLPELLAQMNPNGLSGLNDLAARLAQEMPKGAEAVAAAAEDEVPALVDAAQ